MGLVDTLEGLATVPATLKKIEQHLGLILANTIIIRSQLATQEDIMTDLDDAVAGLQTAVTDLQTRLEGASGEVLANAAENAEKVRAVTAQIQAIAAGGGGEEEPPVEEPPVEPEQQRARRS